MNQPTPTLGQRLAERLQYPSDSPAGMSTYEWVEREMPDLIERIDRLRIITDEWRLDQVRLPGTAPTIHNTLWRAAPNTSAHIRPGDWVALNRSYASAHINEGRPNLSRLDHVLASDIFWAGTDENEFFYLPHAWRRPHAATWQDYLRQISPEQARILCDGEYHRMSTHKDAIQAITIAAAAEFDREAAGYHHGPDHWARVSRNAMACARSLGIDPLLANLFGQVHDSHRESESTDHMHGPRAAQWVQNHARDLFGFLSDIEREHLATACDLHSDGLTEAPPIIQACWDGDRLDLWRVDIEPDPSALCTPYAANPHVIVAAKTGNAPCPFNLWSQDDKEEETTEEVAQNC